VKYYEPRGPTVMEQTLHLLAHGPVSAPKQEQVTDNRPRHNDSICRLTTLAICICTLVIGNAALAQLVLGDTEFDVASDWSIIGPFVVPQDASSASMVAQQRMTDGNPDNLN